MSTLVYNGVTLKFLSTQRVSFDPVYDTLVGRDYLYTAITLDITFVITPGVEPSIGNETPDETWSRINHLLNSPRRPLAYQSSTQPLITVLGTDANNGPLASCAISRVVGQNSLVGTFRVQTFIVDCGTSSGPPYVSNRWTESVDVNELALTRRTRSGTIVARSDLQPNADMLRSLTVPLLEPDFRRLSSQYTLSPDGLRLSYVHTDEEQYLMPPNPAAKAEGRFSITTSDSASFWGECQLRLMGGKPTDKAILLRRAVAIAFAKLQTAGLVPGTNGTYLIMGTMSEDMYANDVSVHLRAMVRPAKARLTTAGSGFSLGNQQLQSGGQPQVGGGAVQPPGPNNGLNTTDTLNWLKVPFIHDDGSGARFDPGTRGTAQLLLTAAALQDPCLRLAVSLAGSQNPNTPAGSDALTPATISIAATIPDDQAALRNTSESGVYSRYWISQKTVLDPNVLELPVGAVGVGPVIIRTGEATARRRVQWVAEKTGGPPYIPDPNVNDPNMVLKKAQVDPGELGLAGDGVSPKYTVRGCYDYVFVNPQQALITAAMPPWMDAQILRSYPFQFAHGIIDNAYGGASMKSVGGNVTTNSGGSTALTTGGTDR